MAKTKRQKKPRRIVFAGAAGSCGKTTGAVNLAAALAARGYRVRVIDMDNQGDASQYLGYAEAPYVFADVLGREKVYPDGTGGLRVPTLAEIEQPFYRDTLDDVAEFGGRTSTRHATIEWMKRITVIPSGIGTTGATLTSVMAALDRQPMGQDRIRLALTTIDENRPVDDVPDFEIIDLYGMPGAYTYQALAIADKVITAVNADDKTTGKNLDKLVDAIEEIAALNSGLRLDAIIPSRVPPSNRGKFYQDELEELETDDRYGKLCTPRIRDAVTVPESYKAGEPLLLYVPSDDVTKDYTAVLDWMDARGVTA